MRRVLVTAMAAAMVVAGCGWRPFGRSSAEDAATPSAAPAPTTATRTTKLPDYPEGAATLMPGQAVEFARTTLVLEQVTPRDGQLVARLTVRDRDGANTHDVEVGGVTVHKDILVRVMPRTGAAGTSAENPVVVLTLHRLSQLASESAPRVAREWAGMRPGEVGFFSGGFVALRAVMENDRNTFDDDAAALLLGLGTSIETVTLRELSSWRAGNWVIDVGDAYGGDATDGPAATIRVRPAEIAEADAPIKEEPLPLPWGSQAPFEKGEISADSIDPPPATAREGATSRTRVLVTVDNGDEAREVVMLPGQTWRWGRHGFRLDTVSSSAASLNVLHYTGERRAVEARSLTEARNPRVRTTDPSAPLRQRVLLTEGESVAFWGTEIQLVRVEDRNRTDLFDDTAEFFVRDGRAGRALQIRERNRDTVRGENRWVVIEVRDLKPATRSKLGEAELDLSTGTFVGDTSDPRIEAEKRPPLPAK